MFLLRSYTPLAARSGKRTRDALKGRKGRPTND